MGKSRKRFASTYRSALTLMLPLVLLMVQIIGLHCDIQQSGAEQGPDVMVHVQHFGTSATCEEDTCERDRPVPAFWKGFDQGWNSAALLAVSFILLLPVPRRTASSLQTSEEFSYTSPIFFRPLLRAPPF
jgi:hypothetical protein